MSSMKSIIVGVITLGLIGALAYYVMQSHKMTTPVAPEKIEVIEEVATHVEASDDDVDEYGLVTFVGADIMPNDESYPEELMDQDEDESPER